MRLIFLLALLVASPCALADDSPRDPLALYRDVVATLGAAETFSVHVEKQYDVILLDGAMVQYSAALDALVRRAGAFHLNYGDDLSAREAWYDGSTLTLIDHLSKVYAQVEASGRVESMLLDVDERYGLELPLAPLLSTRIAGDFESKVQSSTYLGLHDAEGEPCHHVLYRGANVDLQVWVTTDDEPLLRKMLVTFWQIEGSPQQTLIFTEWNLKARAGRRAFKPKLPDGSIRTGFLAVRGE